MYKLIIVESPNKQATIQKYLGSEYKVLASVGHILKLSTKGREQFGIDFDTWEPKYEVEKGKKSVIDNLKKEAQKSSEVLIATDPDREGESIAQNLVDCLGIENKYHRITYNEITKQAILDAIDNPQQINKNLVEAQKARRMLDRIIGFKLSKLMKQTTKNQPTNPSAGRVQSIALKLVCDREKEIENFKPIQYETISAEIENNVTAQLYLKPSVFKNNNTWLTSEIASQAINSQSNFLTVTEYKISTKKDSVVTPFKQSALYREAKYSSKIVQDAAQKLFERGLISYPRTDSTRMNDKFVSSSKKFIEKKYGKDYVAKQVKGFSGSQDAHEAIRPTDLELTPEKAKIEHQLDNYLFYIYELIYNKTLMSLMSVPVREIYSYNLLDNESNYKMSFSKILFKGYSVIKENDEEQKNIPKYEVGSKIPVKKYIHETKQTQPPARYSEGQLIEKLDNIKVGRPSTFATTIKVIKQRLFVESNKNILTPTEFGKVIIEKLVTNFKTIINEDYTSKVEEQLDEIAEGKGKEGKEKLMESFWESFSKTFDEVSKKIEISTLSIQYNGETCPLCGNKLLFRHNKSNRQRFIGCENFPKCKFTKSDETAPKKRTFYKKKSE
ncbi:type I DNA topoisomerase [Mycoplasma miroungirhinis]|uniref:DNA topoisomerase 1 n=1 Tax=Mycoplasma miroungirhinis TaxID=754516 RepID=A0A6M4JAV8_9MOLU|nr:type I DNA topoisomerase [Mycoplasma miroungirhinis]QJR44040.1 type I DNA topoisomerase [Mycoplasma miroungirhinis]